MQTLKILVTGGAGYIGSHVAYDLLELGHEVIVFDNLSTGKLENVSSGAKLIHGDVLNTDQLNNAFNHGIDVVFHFAAWKAAGESMIDPMKYAVNNISGTLNLLNVMIKTGTKNIIFSSSAAVYGEPEYLPIDEKHPTKPTNYYGYTKLCIEQNLEWFSRLKGINYAALRYFNAAGYDVNGRITGREENVANLSPVIMENVFGIRKNIQVFGNDYDTPDGTCIRDYIHVNDLSSAHISAMDYLFNSSENLVVNLGADKGHSVLEMIAAAEKATGENIKFELVGRREGDPKELVASSSKAKEILKWKPKHSDLQTIFKSMIPLYK